MAITTGGLGRPGGLLPTGGLGRREVISAGSGSTIAGQGSLTGSLTGIGEMSAVLVGGGSLSADISTSATGYISAILSGSGSLVADLAAPPVVGPNLAETSVAGRLVFT